MRSDERSTRPFIASFLIFQPPTRWDMNMMLPFAGQNVPFAEI